MILNLNKRFRALFLLLLSILTFNASVLAQTTEDQEIVFSKKRGLYYSTFELELSKTGNPASIYYTLDCSVPDQENGILYTGKIPIDSTIVVKAVAIEANQKSKVFTHTYIFPESSSRQSKAPRGFPLKWSGAKTIDADYEMDPEVINDPAYSDNILEAFESLPSLSLSMETNEWFDPENGVYRGYPNSNVTTEKPVTAEFLFFDKSEESFVVECGVQNQGGSSIVKWKSPKQSMRLLFKEIYGPTRLRKKLFKDSEISSINTLVVDAMLNATWIHPTDDKQRLHAMYLRDQLTSDLYNNMGHLSFHGRYFNLYLNGLYWGIINLHERPDDAFLSEYLDAEREEFDVIKHAPDKIVSGSNTIYLSMLNSARNGFPTYESLVKFESYLNIPAFIDYMILNFYLGNFDWARHNFYAGILKTSHMGFHFYPWDSEHVMRFLNLDYDNTGKNNEGAPTEIHTLLKQNEEYRMMFADAVYKHMFNDGQLTPENFEKSFNFRKEEIEKAIVLESARWGDYRESVSGVTYTKNDYWLVEVEQALEKYIPKRRDIVIEQFRDKDNKLFPKYMPPEINKDTIPGGSMEITLTNPNSQVGDIYYTLDGSDPRLVGGEINGKKYEDKISLNSSSILKTRFYASYNSTWSALAEELIQFDDIYGEKLTINEIMYHPRDNSAEFMELMNFGETIINLKGFELSGGINYYFNADLSLNPGEGLVLTDNATLFKDSYGFIAHDQYLKKLSNSGETVYLRNAYKQLVDSVMYSDTIPWPVQADGEGYSLELKSPDLDNSLWSSWKVSDQLDGNPYATVEELDLDFGVYPNPFIDKILIHLNANVSSSELIAIEVYNQTGSLVYFTESSFHNSKISLQPGALNTGIYFIKIGANKTNSFKGGTLKAIKLN